MGMGWGLQRGNWGQSIFIPRPVQPLPPSSSVGRTCSWFFPQARHLVVLLVLSTSRPLQSAPKNQGTPGPAQGPPQEKGESTPKLPTLTLSRKTPCDLGCPVLFLNA